MELGLRGRVAIVCAASQGLGKAAAAAFAREGAHVVLCSRDRKRIRAAAEEIAESTPDHPGRILPIVADVTNPRHIKRLVMMTAKAFGRVDILVTNAGGPPVGEFPELDDAAWEKGLSLTLMSVIRCIREVLPHMQKHHWGRIINITSIAAKQPINDLIVSSTLRPGIIGLSKVLAGRYGSDGITVNNVAPGYMLTSRQKAISAARAAKRGVSHEQELGELSRGIPMRRYGDPDELASVIVFLASEKAGYMTGATISVDGGLTQGLL